MARIVMLAEFCELPVAVTISVFIRPLSVADDDEEYCCWVANNVQKYIASRHTPYNIAFAFGSDKQVHVITT